MRILALSAVALIFLFSVSYGQGERLTLTLDQAVSWALDHNPKVIAAQKAWDVARSRVWPARMPPDPEVTFEYEALPGAFRLSRFGERNVGFSQTLEFPTKSYLRGRVADRVAQAARRDYESIRIGVAADVTKACGRIWASELSLKYAVETLRLAEAFRDKTWVRVEAGDVSSVEALRAEVEAGRAEAEAGGADNRVTLARAALNALLNRDLSAPIEVMGELTYKRVETDAQALRKTSLEHRPDLQRAQAALEGARAGRGLAASSLLPDLHFGLSRQTIRGAGSFYKTGFGFTVPIWALGRQRGEIAGAGAGLDRAEAEQIEARNRALLEVEETSLNVRTSEKRVLLCRERVLPGAEETYRVVRRRYDEGKSNYLEVIDASRTLAETRTAYVEALLDYHMAVADLTKAVGGTLEIPK
jgi:cobalt-zinc-cadmium efflux system outer membrane protein